MERGSSGRVARPAAQKAPNSEWAAFSRQEGKPAAALSLAERGAREYPGSEVCARELGFARFRRKDCAGAYGAVARFEATTSDPNTLNALGLFETCRGKLDSAGG